MPVSSNLLYDHGAPMDIEKWYYTDSFYYKYFDSPDGEDLALKAFYIGRTSAKLGAAAALIDIFTYSAPRTYWFGITRMAHHILPATLIPPTYPYIAFAAKSLREKDDWVNHFISGFTVAMMYFAGVRRKFADGLLYGGILGVACGTYKHSKDTMDHSIFLQPGLRSAPFNSFRRYTKNLDPTAQRVRTQFTQEGLEHYNIVDDRN